MFKQPTTLLIAAMLLVTAALIGTAHAGSRIGGGVHYLHNLGDINEGNFDKNAFSILGSYQAAGPVLKMEADLEYVFDLYGTGESAWQPQAYLLAGGLIYGGVGIGASYFNGDWADDPFYLLRGGVDLPLAGMDLDVFATYMFWNSDQFNDISGDDWDSLTLAALLRFDI